MRVTTCALSGVLFIEPAVYADDRGFFLESFAADAYSAVGITEEFVQDNHSRSKRNVLRGLHFTKHHPQSQILTVIRGTIFDVLVDIRPGSPTFGRWLGTEMSDDGRRQVYMPHGFAHGFYVLSDWADLHYKVSQRYDPDAEGGIIWNDPTLGITWPATQVNVSERDLRHRPFAEL